MGIFPKCTRIMQQSLDSVENIVLFLKKRVSTKTVLKVYEQ